MQEARSEPNAVSLVSFCPLSSHRLRGTDPADLGLTLALEKLSLASSADSALAKGGGWERVDAWVPWIPDELMMSQAASYDQSRLHT